MSLERCWSPGQRFAKQIQIHFGWLQFVQKNLVLKFGPYFCITSGFSILLVDLQYGRPVRLIPDFKKFDLLKLLVDNYVGGVILHIIRELLVSSITQQHHTS